MVTVIGMRHEYVNCNGNDKSNGKCNGYGNGKCNGNGKGKGTPTQIWWTRHTREANGGDGQGQMDPRHQHTFVRAAQDHADTQKNTQS